MVYQRPSPYTIAKSVGGLIAASVMPKSKSSTSKGVKVATRTYNSGRQLRKQPKAELKAYDVATSAIDFETPATGTIIANPLNAVQLGTEMYNRIGRKIYMKSIQVRGFVTCKGTSVQDVGRIFLIYDSQPNGAAPTIANVFSNMNAAATTNGLSHINLNNRQRFTILRDHQIVFPAVTNTAGVLTNGPSWNDTQHETYNIEWFIKLQGKETIFNNLTAGNVGDIVSGALFIGTVSQNTDLDWTFTFNTRLRFYD